MGNLNSNHFSQDNGNKRWCQMEKGKERQIEIITREVGEEKLVRKMKRAD